MAPKEKAKELLDKFWSIDTVMPVPTKALAMQCALIAVDEMINEYSQNSTFAQLEWVDYRIALLREVKLEIEKL